MPYNIKQLGEKSVSIDFFIVDPTEGDIVADNTSNLPEVALFHYYITPSLYYDVIIAIDTHQRMH